MFTIDELLQPQSLAEAGEMLSASPDLVVLGGCGFLKLGSRRIGKALDLSRCGLGNIMEENDHICIGAMTTLYDIEKNPSLLQFFNGVLPRAIGNILGTQFRRCATMGASVYSKYGFSDILPALLVLDTEVELLKNGRMALPEFLAKPITRDILTRIYIKKDQRHAAYQNLRNASADFPMLNAAVSKQDNQWKIVVGARPGIAQLAAAASRLLSERQIEHMNAEEVAEHVAQELTFGNNNKATADYRRAMCKVLVKRAIGEVVSCS